MFYGGIIFGFIGASFRWIIGSIWRTFLSKKKYSFSEYLNGPNGSDDDFDKLGSGLINRVVGFIVLMLICWLIFKLSI